ncbi:MAG TPA: SAM-dependent methyltransferase [Trebonia sp.]|nr:SAM-dependent methyltransferase [Trebonia sp.]
MTSASRGWRGGGRGGVRAGRVAAVRQLRRDLSPGERHGPGDRGGGQAITLRSEAEVADLVAGLVPVPPGLAPVTEWRADADPRFDSGAPVPVYGIVARKP